MQGFHAAFHGDFLDFRGFLAPINCLNQPVVGNHELVNPNPPFVACIIAAGTALWVMLEYSSTPSDSRIQNFFFSPGGLVLYSTGLAYTTHEPLGTDTEKRRGNHERLDIHVRESGNRARSIVSMQRANQQVAGKCRFNRYIRRFRIPNLANEDNVRILTQEGS